MFYFLQPYVNPIVKRSNRMVLQQLKTEKKNNIDENIDYKRDLDFIKTETFFVH